MRVLVAEDLRDICDLLVAGMLGEMFGQRAGYPVPDTLAARG
jgi:hypothetical protein